jgi:5-methylcytosine-specific restriction protein A
LSFEGFDTSHIPEEICDPIDKIFEGAVRTISINTYERKAKARKICVQHYGFLCSVCQCNLKDTYGEIGDGYIHVHHIIPLAEIGAEYQLDPIRDLRPVCPNCHAMLHTQKPPYTIEEMKDIIKNAT